VALLCAAALPAQAGQPVVEWLPDLIFAPGALATNVVDTTEIPGRVLFRFNSSLPNIGLGEFRLEATGQLVGNGRQEVVQVVQRSDGSTFERDAGDFLYNEEDFHMETAGWADYRIREVLTGDGVGPVLREGAKESVRITSSTWFDLNLPNVPPFSSRLLAYLGTHGISVGYTDLYPYQLPKQWIDVTGLESGTYWLEVEVDGANQILESDETNNVTRIKVTLNLPEVAEGEGEGEGEGGVEGEGTPEGALENAHTADIDADARIGLGELLRVIQFYNSGALACLAGTEDGYVPGSGDETCAPHSADYAPQDWRIRLSELVRCIQIFNALGYMRCVEGEDGFCPLFAPPQ
jgi:hypothetical protein